MTLLRLGQGEGSLIIQMFGRVVRFAGRNNDGKRLDKPSAAIKPLQTAYVYGLKSAYLETFLNGLYRKGDRASFISMQRMVFSVSALRKLKTCATTLRRVKSYGSGKESLRLTNKIRRTRFL